MNTEHDDDLTVNAMMALSEASGVLDFWGDPEEDIYPEEDENPQKGVTQ